MTVTRWQQFIGEKPENAPIGTLSPADLNKLGDDMIKHDFRNSIHTTVGDPNYQEIFNQWLNVWLPMCKDQSFSTEDTSFTNAAELFKTQTVFEKAQVGFAVGSSEPKVGVVPIFIQPYTCASNDIERYFAVKTRDLAWGIFKHADFHPATFGNTATERTLYNNLARNGPTDHQESASRLLYSLHTNKEPNTSNDIVLYNPRNNPDFFTRQTIEHVLPQTLGNIFSTNDLNNMMPSCQLYNKVRGNADFVATLLPSDGYLNVIEPTDETTMRNISSALYPVRMQTNAVVPMYNGYIRRFTNVLNIVRENTTNIDVHVATMTTLSDQEKAYVKTRLSSLRYCNIEDMYDRAAFARKWLYARAMYTIMGDQGIDATRHGNGTRRICISPRQRNDLDNIIDLAFDSRYAPRLTERQIDMQIASMYNGWHNPLINPPMANMVLEQFHQKMRTSDDDVRMGGRRVSPSSDAHFQNMKVLLRNLILVGYNHKYDLI